MTETTPPRRTHHLSAHRVEPAVYVARNERGAEVRVGGSDADGVFSPGELLQIAAACCAALSADHVLSSQLGENFNASLTVGAEGVKDESRYSHFETKVVADMSELDADRHEALIERAEKAIERLCAVARTLHNGATTTVELVADDGAAETIIGA